MNRQEQAFLHDPQNGQWGDCYRTCLAMLLGVDRDDVPHHHYAMADGEQWTVYREWLTSQGAGMAHFVVHGADVAWALEAMTIWNPGMPFMLGGGSPRGTDHSVVVTGDGQIIDPHPSMDGLIGPDSGGLITISVVTPAQAAA